MGLWQISSKNVFPKTVYNFFFCFFMFLLTAAIVKNSHNWARTYFILLRKPPTTKLEVL